MTIQNRHKEALLKLLKDAIKNGTPWMDYPAFQNVIRPRTVSFHKKPEEAKEKVRVWSGIYGKYGIVPVVPLFKALRLQIRLESLGIVQTSPLRIDAERMTEKYLQDKRLPADLLTKNTTIVGTSHVISDELFTKALAEIGKGHQFIVYNTSRHLLGLQDMHFLKDEASAKLFTSLYLPSAEDLKTFKAGSLMDIFDHFEVNHILKQDSSPLKNTNMEQDNYEQLTKSLRYAGYGETLNDRLKEEMAKGEKEFSIQHSLKFNNEHALAILYFRKSDTTEKYFFNKHELTISKGNAPDQLCQMFWLNYKQDNITLKEGLNLLQGRAVYKELTSSENQKYNAWVQLDFKNYDENCNFKYRTFNDNWGFKLEETLNKYPITALKNEEDKKILMGSLERGNRQSITMEVDGKEVKAFIEASPQFRTLNFYDQHMKEKQAHELTGKITEGQSVKNNAKISDDDIDRKQSAGQRL